MDEMEEQRPESRREKLLKEIIEFFSSLPDEEPKAEAAPEMAEVAPKEEPFA